MAIEIMVSVLAKVAEYLVEPALREGECLFCAGKIISNLESKKKELILVEGRVQKRIEEALNRTEEIDDAVNKWKSEVKNVIAEVDNLEKQMMENQGCFQGWKRYRLRKQMAKKTRALIQLGTNDDFNPFSYPAKIKDIEYFSSANFMNFKSTKLASNQLLEALRDNNSYMIGLYGMGGSGKTSLVKQVGKKAKELKLFDRVVFTTVSQTPNITRIQDEIADLLGLSFSENSEAVRARKISLRLQKEERVLIILDDIWATLSLESIGIGIPSGNTSNNCKILLTTRRRQVCTLMDCQRKIPLHLLSQDEAWILFQKHCSVSDATRLVAQEIANECKGLPIAIEAVGKSLKEKGMDEMNVALHRLRHSKPIDIVDEGVRDAFTCLQLSYDYLRSEEDKLLFLLCAMFPEDHEIFMEDLIRYGIGLGICKEVVSFEISRSQVKAGINNLIDSCLLIQEKRDRLKMHDMIRDVALWIASKENRNIMVNLPTILNALGEDGALKDFYAVSLWCDKIDQFPLHLHAPKLEILLLNLERFLDLSCVSFEGMKGLKVWAVTGGYLDGPVLVSLPQTSQWLANLRTLRLLERELGDISFVLSLTRLEILDLRGSKFNELPNGIEKLNKLKLLDLLSCKVDECCCYKSIGRCSQLEELYVSVYYGNHRTKETYECFQGNVTLPNLQRHILKMGPIGFDKGLEDVSKRGLFLGDFNISTSSGPAMKHLLQRATEVYLVKLQGGCKNIIPEMVQAVGAMDELTYLKLHSCSEIECFSITNPGGRTYSFRVHDVLPMLANLSLDSMDNLKQVFCGPPLLLIFQKLEYLSISNCPQLYRLFPDEYSLFNLKSLEISGCPKLASLFPMSAARTLLNLKHLMIRNCIGMKQVIMMNEEGLEILNQNPGLMFPELKKLSVDDCCKLEEIFPISCAQNLVKLQEVFISDSNELKYVFGQQDHVYGSSYPDKIHIVLPILEVLKLQRLPNLVNIFPENYHPSWPSLGKVDWLDCPKLAPWSINNVVGLELGQPNSSSNKEIVMNGHEMGHRVLAQSPTILNVEQVFIRSCEVTNIFHIPEDGLGNNQLELMASKLKSLNLEHLPELRFTWTGVNLAQILSLRYLQHITINQCRKLKCVFSAVIHRSLPNLTELFIHDCKELEGIFEEISEEPQNLSGDQVCFPSLQELVVRGCNKLKTIFSIDIPRLLPQPHYLRISEATQLEQNFRDRDNSGADMETVLLNLRKLKLPSLVRFSLISAPISEADFYPKEELLVRTVIVNSSQLSEEAVTLRLRSSSHESLDIQNCGLVDMFHRQQEEAAQVEVVALWSKHHIWRGPMSTQILRPQYLHTLEVTRCGKMKSIFFMDVIDRIILPELTLLKLSDCEELEGIVSQNNKDKQYPSLMAAGVCVFPKLREIRVVRCNKLKSLFSTTIAKMLPKLEALYIAEAAQLEDLFRPSSSSIYADIEAVVLPNLRNIQVSCAPTFINNMLDGVLVPVRLPKCECISLAEVPL